MSRPATSEARSAARSSRTLPTFRVDRLAIAAFLVTRAIATSNREMTLADAAEWFRRGQRAMQAGTSGPGDRCPRRALSAIETTYTIHPCPRRGVVAEEDYEGARSVLIDFRESDPEDREINLQLARLAAARQDVTEALRFYHNALYAPWPNDMVRTRRRVRIELARFLLAHRPAGRALAELLALTADMPDEVALHLEVAQLFADAGDQDPRARPIPARAPARSRTIRPATAGAGLAAFTPR